MPNIPIQLILDSLSEGVCTTCMNWSITSFNRAAERITGFSADEAVGGPFERVFRPEFCRCLEYLQQVVQTGQPVHDLETRILAKRPHPIPIRLNASPVWDGDTILGTVMTFRDISDVETLRKELKSSYSFEDIVGKSPRLREVLDILPSIAQSDSTVLLLGESGTGKERMAQAIHRSSHRADGPFVAVQCGALPDNLLESELFGYKKGAFTDAKTDKPGRFAVARGGTLFLDEIGDVSPAMQVKLLRVLQERHFQPLGATQSEEADVRIIAATNRDLKAMMQEGTFRSDLYYRINVVPIRLPSLQERSEDIPLLVEHFIEKFNAESGRQIEGISPAAVRRLMRYEFPGNIRELENIIERAYAVCPLSEIQEQCLPADVFEPGEIVADSLGGLTGCATAVGIQLDARRKTLSQDEEKQRIIDTLGEHQNHRRRAAAALGIDPSTLWRKMKKYGLL